jgi:ketosteroid isomerase-like protein
MSPPIRWILLVTLISAAPARAQDGVVTAGQTEISLPDTARYSPAERAIVRLEVRRSEAIAAHDTSWLATLYAEDFTGVVGNGLRVDRAALFAVFSRDNPGARFAIDELSVRALSEGAAIVTGRLRSPAADGASGFESRYLHVYALHGGTWRLVAAQGTAVRG